MIAFQKKEAKKQTTTKIVDEDDNFYYASTEQEVFKSEIVNTGNLGNLASYIIEPKEELKKYYFLINY